MRMLKGCRVIEVGWIYYFEKEEEINECCLGIKEEEKLNKFVLMILVRL